MLPGRAGDASGLSYRVHLEKRPVESIIVSLFSSEGRSMQGVAVDLQVCVPSPLLPFPF